MPTFAGVTPKTAVRSAKRRSQRGGDLHAAADAVAADHRDGRLREVPQGGLRGQVVAPDVGHRVVRVGAAEQVGDVGAGAEARAGAGHDEDADVGVAGQRGQDAGQRGPHGRRHRVALLGPVDGQDGDVRRPGATQRRWFRPSAEVVRAERVAARRVAGLVAGA